MPINIYSHKTSHTAVLCQGCWDLAEQIDALETWLLEHQGEKQWPKNHEYIADIGFSVRQGVTGGGAVLSSQCMSIMGEIGMSLHFSEYSSGSRATGTGSTAQESRNSKPARKKGERSKGLKKWQEDIEG